MSYNSFIKTNIAPYAAHWIGVYNSSGQRVGSIALDNFKPTYGERLYRFGILSDVHNEETDRSSKSCEVGVLSYIILRLMKDKEGSKLNHLPPVVII